jgi:hypothetical protein
MKSFSKTHQTRCFHFKAWPLFQANGTGAIQVAGLLATTTKHLKMQRPILIHLHSDEEHSVPTLSFSFISGSVSAGVSIVARQNLDWRCSMGSLAIRRATPQAQRRLTAAARSLRSELISDEKSIEKIPSSKCPGRKKNERNWTLSRKLS